MIGWNNRPFPDADDSDLENCEVLEEEDDFDN